MWGMFKGPDGKISMMRASTFIVVISIMGVFVAHNIVAMVAGAAFVSIGFSEAGLIAAAIGVKAYQSSIENKDGKAAADLSAGSDISETALMVPEEDVSKVNKR